MILFGINQTSDAQWTKVTISGRWSIEFPSSSTTTLPGTGAWPVIISHSSAGHPTFEVRYHKLKGKPMDLTLIDAALDTDLRDYATEVGGTVVRTVAPHDWKKGRSMVGDIENPNQMKAKVRTFIHKGNEKFILIIHNQGSYPPVISVERFWNSLTP